MADKARVHIGKGNALRAFKDLYDDALTVNGDDAPCAHLPVFKGDLTQFVKGDARNALKRDQRAGDVRKAQIFNFHSASPFQR